MVILLFCFLIFIPPPHKNIYLNSRKYKLGIICHYLHRKKIKYDEGVLFIDILRRENEITKFIDEICQCEKIISSSLHGIIIANAYGIPARWFMIDGYPLGGNPYKKFYDYFMSVNMPIQEPLIIKENSIITYDFKLDVDMAVDLKIDINKLKYAFPY